MFPSVFSVCASQLVVHRTKQFSVFCVLVNSHCSSMLTCGCSNATCLLCCQNKFMLQTGSYSVCLCVCVCVCLHVFMVCMHGCVCVCVHSCVHGVCVCARCVCVVVCVCVELAQEATWTFNWASVVNEHFTIVTVLHFMLPTNVFHKASCIALVLILLFNQTSNYFSFYADIQVSALNVCTKKKHCRHSSSFTFPFPSTDSQETFCGEYLVHCFCILHTSYKPLLLV